MRAVALVLALVLLAPLTAAERQDGVERAPYTLQPAGIECGTLVEGDDCPLDVPNSRVQFGPFHADEMDARVHDASGKRVGATYTFYSEGGVELAVGALCGAARNVPVPEGAAYVQFRLDTPLTGTHCRAATATFGEVVARFR